MVTFISIQIIHLFESDSVREADSQEGGKLCVSVKPNY